MDIVSGAKNVGTALATAATLGYASGYLVLRARAYALGMDPNFAFLDETYIFAGFRFLSVALIALLVAAPVLILVRAAALWIGRLLNPVNPVAFSVVEWIAVGGLAVVTVLGFRILQVRGILLANDDTTGGPPRKLVDAALGRNAIGLYVTVVTVAFAALAASWLYTRWSQAAGFDLIFVLVIVTTLQFLMLPIYHGMFYADRNVRVLERAPASVTDLMPPIGIVDRTADYASVFGQTATGQRRIVPVKTKDLNGVAVIGIEPLRDFLAQLAKRTAAGAITMGLVLPATAVTASPVAEVVAPPAAMEAGTTMTDVQRSFWTRVTDHLQATFEAIGSLNEGKAVSGRIWIVEVEGVAARGTARPVAALDNLSWPVSGADGGDIYALRGRQVVRLTESNGAVTIVGGEASWRKLIGNDADGVLLGFVADGPFGRPAVMSAAGVLSTGPPPQTDKDRMRHAVLLQDSRTYADGRRLVVRPSERGGRGLDVFIERDGYKPTNLSDCGDDFCGQPSLSADGTRVLWIRAPAL